MKKLLVLLLVLVAVVTLGCQGQEEPLPQPMEPIVKSEPTEPLVVVSEQESYEIATKYLEESNEFAKLSGRNLRYMGSETLRCPYCWTFTYWYYRLSPETNASQKIEAMITVNSGKVIAATFEERK